MKSFSPPGNFGFNRLSRMKTKMFRKKRKKEKKGKLSAPQQIFKTKEANDRQRIRVLSRTDAKRPKHMLQPLSQRVIEPVKREASNSGEIGARDSLLCRFTKTDTHNSRHNHENLMMSGKDWRVDAEASKRWKIGQIRTLETHTNHTIEEYPDLYKHETEPKIETAQEAPGFLNSNECALRLFKKSLPKISEGDVNESFEATGTVSAEIKANRLSNESLAANNDNQDKFTKPESPSDHRDHGIKQKPTISRILKQQQSKKGKLQAKASLSKLKHVKLQSGSGRSIPLSNRPKSLIIPMKRPRNSKLTNIMKNNIQYKKGSASRRKGWLANRRIGPAQNMPHLSIHKARLDSRSGSNPLSKTEFNSRRDEPLSSQRGVCLDDSHVPGMMQGKYKRPIVARARLENVQNETQFRIMGATGQGDSTDGLDGSRITLGEEENEHKHKHISENENGNFGKALNIKMAKTDISNPASNPPKIKLRKTNLLKKLMPVSRSPKMRRKPGLRLGGFSGISNQRSLDRLNGRNTGRLAGFSKTGAAGFHRSTRGPSPNKAPFMKNKIQNSKENLVIRKRGIKNSATRLQTVRHNLSPGAKTQLNQSSKRSSKRLYPIVTGRVSKKHSSPGPKLRLMHSNSLYSNPVRPSNNQNNNNRNIHLRPRAGPQAHFQNGSSRVLRSSKNINLNSHTSGFGRNSPVQNGGYQAYTKQERAQGSRGNRGKKKAGLLRKKLVCQVRASPDHSLGREGGQGLSGKWSRQQKSRGKALGLRVVKGRQQFLHARSFDKMRKTGLARK